MATAILVDATRVRMVLAPALMELMGRANGWLPLVARPRAAAAGRAARQPEGVGGGDA
ncbi:MAG TPA: hypothetical protein VFN99_10705 [Gaiella sp.]|nr:hypothetical protein [Gaiella sp.]